MGIEAEFEAPFGNRVQIYPAPLYAKWMTNNDFYTLNEPVLPTDTKLKKSPHLQVSMDRRNNVEFSDASKTSTAMADYQNHSVVRIRAGENIPELTELYVCYG